MVRPQGNSTDYHFVRTVAVVVVVVATEIAVMKPELVLMA